MRLFLFTFLLTTEALKLREHRSPWTQTSDSKTPQFELKEKSSTKLRSTAQMKSLLKEVAAMEKNAVRTADRTIHESKGGDLNAVVGVVNVKDPEGNFARVGKSGWLSTIFHQNADICKKFGHKFIVREMLATIILPWQNCGKQQKCLSENANFEKHRLMAESLEDTKNTHVLILDADAVLVQGQKDSLKVMADELDKSGKDILMADEDWRVGGKGRVNGGVIFAKNTAFTRKFFKEFVQAHVEGPQYNGEGLTCTSNDQVCLQYWLNKNSMGLKQHLHLASGINYNFAPQVWANRQLGRYPITVTERKYDDPDLHIIHFMGAYKNLATKILPGSSSKTAKLKAESGEQMCNDDYCFDIKQECGDIPKRANEKFAFVLTHTLDKKLRWNPETNLDMMVKHAQKHSMDVVLIIPNGQTDMPPLFPLMKEDRLFLAQKNVSIMEVPWKAPPNAKLNRNQKWCAQRGDFIKLHALGLTQYDAIAYYDTDVEIQGDVTPMLRCASENLFLSSPGSEAPLNAGFFAVKPSKHLFDAAVSFAQRAEFSYQTGWDNTGFSPHRHNYQTADCGAGFLHTFFYKNSSLANTIMEEHGWERAEPKMVDSCEWNYQHGCSRHFECTEVKAMHKESLGNCVKHGKHQSKLLKGLTVSEPMNEGRLVSISKGGMWVKEGPLKGDFAKKLYSGGTYGFYLHTYRDASATVHLLRDVRRVYPEDPVYVMSDGGLDFSGICAEIGNCKFQWQPSANDRWNPQPFFHRFKQAAAWLQTKYIVMLEPDNEVQNKMTSEPATNAQAGGLRDTNPALSPKLISYLEEKGSKASGNANFHLAWERFGLAGGSFFLTDAVLDAFDAKSIDWKHVRSLESKRVWSSDVAMPIALAVHGYSYFPWDEGVTQKRFGLQANAAWRHYGRDELKPYSGVQLAKEDATLVKEYAAPHGDPVTCQGCVWVSDKTCWAQEPPVCPHGEHDYHQ